MRNLQIEKAWGYHNRTKHSPESVRAGAHYLDWDNYPLLFKIYPRLPPIALPELTVQSQVPALAAVAGEIAPRGDAVPTLGELTHLLYFSAGITKRRKSALGGEILYRAAACTGALYEIELYVVCGPLAELDAGVYHFNPGDLALRRLRAGDHRGAIARACAQEGSAAHAPVIVVSTGTYWRNAWKYQARTYRHFGWDNGVIHANLLAMAAALRFPARVICGFADREVNRLLGLDTHREVALALVALGAGSPVPEPPREVASLHLETAPLSRREIDYPLMRDMHSASSLSSPEDVAEWRRAAVTEPVNRRPLSDEGVPQDTIEEVIRRRGSSRRFRREPISAEQFATILDRATRSIPADFTVPGAHWNDIYVVAHAVDGLRPGAYFYHPAERSLELLKEGNFRDQAAYLALEQDLAGDAAAAIFFLSDLNRLLPRLGNRGYRVVQFEAGILGGKVYLGAYAQRLGATGLTFYDDDVTRFFSPHAAGKSAIFLVAVGVPARGLSS